MEQLTERLKEVMNARITEEDEVKGNLIKVYNDDLYGILFLAFDSGKWAMYGLNYESYPDGVFVKLEAEYIPDTSSLTNAGIITKEEATEQQRQERKYMQWCKEQNEHKRQKRQKTK